jgi:hypothetical protein
MEAVVACSPLGVAEHCVGVQDALEGTGSLGRRGVGVPQVGVVPTDQLTVGVDDLGLGDVGGDSEHGVGVRGLH